MALPSILLFIVTSPSLAVPSCLAVLLVFLLLLLLVLLNKRANRNAVRLLHAWKRARGK